jgi:hypothetical protein
MYRQMFDKFTGAQQLFDGMRSGACSPKKHWV